jgi:hypothetical protein
MAVINVENMKLIVEKNLKDIGGIPVNSWSETSLQSLRDAIAQSIVDALSDITIAGNPSISSVMGTQTFITRNNAVLTLGTSSQTKVGLELNNWILASHTYMTAANSPYTIAAANAAYMAQYANILALPIKTV